MHVIYLVSTVGLNSLDEHCLTIVLIWKGRFIKSIAMKVDDKFCVVTQLSLSVAQMTQKLQLCPCSFPLRKSDNENSGCMERR